MSPKLAGLPSLAAAKVEIYPALLVFHNMVKNSFRT
jgi:hypothetical protein